MQFLNKYKFLLIIIFVAGFLRLFNLNSNPPSLYWDEASLGYNAYAIKTAGIDEHGERFPLTRFIAFGDYKPPGYIYATVLSISIWGLSEFAIRFPSALAGIMMVIFCYFLTFKLTRKREIALISSLLVAISPWSLQLSRAAFEGNLAACFNLIGITLFVYAVDKKWLYPFSFLFFTLSFYTFNANRILAPLVIVLLLILYGKDFFKSGKWLVITIVISVILIWPNIAYFQTRESRLRFDEVSIFNNLDIIKKSNERIQRNGYALWAKIIFNRRVYFAQEFLVHYFDHFKGEFLFISGDRNPRLSTQDVGELYIFELPLLLFGLYQLIMKKDKTSIFLLSWLLIAPIPSGLSKETPHMLRSASSLPIYQIIGAIGAYSLWFITARVKKYIKFSIISLFSLLVIGNLIYYFHNYWIHYPQEWSSQWQYGYKQMVKKVAQIQDNYDKIYVTPEYGRPYIYFLLYNQVNPQDYVNTRRAKRDWFGFWTVDGYGKYYFSDYSPSLSSKVLLVTIPGKIPPEKIKDRILDLQGNTVFEIGEP